MKQLYLGKQMMAGSTLPVHPETETFSCPSVGIVKSATSWRVSPSRSAFEMLERYAMKVAFFRDGDLYIDLQYDSGTMRFSK